MHESEIAEEQQFLEEAYAAHSRLLEEAETNRKRFAVPLEGGPGDMEVREASMETFMRRIEDLQVGDTALYFGRLDFLPEANRGDRPFRLGRLSISDEDQNQLIVDWRAPVAEAFYRATAVETFDVHRRRHVAIRSRRVMSVEDEYLGGSTESVAGDLVETDEGYVEGSLNVGGPAALLAALGRARTGRMGDIVATIQREQDEIIRSPLNCVLLVQGGPGTGKTAVALHRAAYLLYTYRTQLERQNGVLVVGPNPVFMHYISNVLPSLGESGVTLSTTGRMVRGVDVTGRESDALAQLKGDVRMVRVMARALATRQRSLRQEVEIPFGVTILRVRPEDTAPIVERAKSRPGQHNPRRSAVGRELAQVLAQQYRKKVGPASVTSYADDNELKDAIRSLPAFKECVQRIWPRLTGQDLVRDLFGAEALLRVAGRGVLSDDEISLLVRPRGDSMESVAWTEADLPLIDEARALLGPRKKPRSASRVVDSELSLEDIEMLPEHVRGAAVRDRRANTRVLARDYDEAEFIKYGHIVVDEAQDLSAMQLRVVARRTDTGSMTIVGDMAQATTAAASASWEETLRVIGVTKQPVRVDLTVSYRTPEEVLTFAQPTLHEAMPTLAPPEPIRRVGVSPRIVSVDDLHSGLVATVREELDEIRDGRVAVIVTTTRVVEIVGVLRAGGLDAADPDTSPEGGLAADVVVIAAEGANGLEFDGVIVVEPSEIASRGGVPGSVTPRGLRTLYVSLTRPTRRLALVHTQPLPPTVAKGPQT